MSEQHYRTCHLCEAMCGVVIQHDAGRIHSIKGDPDDVLSRGHVCPKAVALQDLQDDPDRLRRPLKRVGEDWVEISWDEAFEAVENGLKKVQDKYGRHAVATYLGNPTVHNPGAMLMAPALLGVLGTPNRFSATSLDQLPNMLASLQLFGHQLLLPVPDLDRTDFLLCLGANPAASGGSLMSAGDPMGRIKALRARGGRVVVVDPRRTETALKADEHLFITPGSDVFLLAALLNVIFAHGLARPGRLKPWLTGLEELATLVAPFTPEQVAPLTGISAERIETLAREFAAAHRAVCYGRVGTAQQAFGGTATWLIYVLNLITGRMDEPGGMMFTRPAIDLVGLSAALPLMRGSFGSYRSRGRGLPEFGGELPTATLAEEILTPGKGQIHALITHAGNPALSAPNGRQVEQALAQLDFMVAIDCYLNETTCYADIILPPTGPLEHGHYDLIFNAVATHNVAKYSPPLKAPPADSRHDWQILLELAIRLGSEPGLARKGLRQVQRGVEALGLEGMLDGLLRSGPYGQQPAALKRGLKWLGSGWRWSRWSRSLPNWLGTLLAAVSWTSDKAQGLSLATLKQHPHGLDLGPLAPCLPGRLLTADGHIPLVPVIYREDWARVTAALEAGPTAGLRLIGRRHARSNNSWLHNSHRLVKGPVRCTAFIHPSDAERLGVIDGAQVRLRSRVGELVLPAQVTEAVMPGVISVPHGWGHGRPGSRMQIAAAHAGVSANDLTDEQVVDALTGMAVFNGVPVELDAVAPAAERIATRVEPESAEA